MSSKTAGLLILGLVGCAILLIIAESKRQPHPVNIQQEASLPTPQAVVATPHAVVATPGASEQQSVDSVTVRGKEIQVNVTTADEAFEVLTTADETAPAVTSESPIMPGGMVIVHHYEIAGRGFTVEFARDTDSGPYMVKGILATP